MVEYESSDWNAASIKVTFLAKLTNNLRAAFMRAANNPTKSNIKKYYHIIQGTLMETRPYLNIDEEEIDDLENRIEKYGNWVNSSGKGPKKAFEKLKEVDKDLKAYMRDAGLEIPLNKKVDPENVAVEGLME